MNRSAKFIGLIFLCLIGTSIHQIQAQIVNSDTLVYPITTTGQSFENYLVSLAWQNNPAYKIHASNINIAQTEIKLAKRAWADDWNITLNLNENNLMKEEEPLPGEEPAVTVNNFPRYNFGLALNLGSLVTRGLEVDIAEQNLFIEEYTQDQDKMEIRSEVYKAYTEYNQAITKLKIVTKQEQNAQNIYDLMKTRFKDGQIDFDTYSQATSEYNTALESLITAEEKVTLTSMSIEALTGVSLSMAKYYYDQNNGQ